nr:(d)CMP kinase [Maliibacterium massiliense]
MQIAIDGPSGAGKSTIAKALAKKLQMTYLDTGAMYRAIALKTLRMGLTAADVKGIETMLKHTDVSIAYIDGVQHVLLDGEDVSGLIRTNRVSKAASDTSAIPAVRQKLLELQRSIARSRDVVLDGRDIGTFVLPHATYKFFLTAKSQERARRRYEELLARGIAAELNDVHAQILQRDHNDSHRAIAPLKKAEDAVEIDSTFNTPDEVLQMMLDYIERNPRKA